MVQKFYDELAYGMERVLADEEYQKIFAKPKIKTASAQAPEPVKLSADGITDTFKTIVTLSAMLDDMGYEESAAKLLRVAQDIGDKLTIEDMGEGTPEADQYFAGLRSEEERGADLDELLRGLSGEGSGGAWDVGADKLKSLPFGEDVPLDADELRGEEPRDWQGPMTDMDDANDAMDKPSTDDKEEGNPEC